MANAFAEYGLTGSQRPRTSGERAMLVLLVILLSGCNYSYACNDEVKRAFINFLRSVNLEEHDSSKIGRTRDLLKSSVRECEVMEAVEIEGYGSFSREHVLVASGETNRVAFAKRNLDELLLYAARYGDLATVKELIDVGADPTIQDEFGNTALMNSVGGAQVDGEISCFLISKGVDVSAENSAGLTAYDLSIEERDQSAMSCLSRAKK